MKRIELRVAGSGPANQPAGLATWPLLAKGFRPFFLLAALYVALVLPVWLLWLHGAADPGSALRGMDWHAHEMIFGFSMAVVAGFLLTAAANWTGRETATGGVLLVLVLLWLAGRMAVLLPVPAAFAALSLAFIPALALVLGRAIVSTRNRRNYAFLGLLVLLWTAELLVQLDVLGVLPGWRRRAHMLAVDLLVVMILAMGGRVIPLFTRNATGQSRIRNLPGLDRAAVATMVGVAAASLTAPDHAATAVLCFAAGALAAARAVHWGTRHTLREPLLWVLHVAYAWIPLGLVLRALSTDNVIASAAGTHALTAGAIGTMTLGMMARVALGHTGRPLAAPRPVGLAFVVLSIAVVCRTLIPLVIPGAYRTLLLVSGSLFAAAFALFAVAYAPILLRPRLDGRPG